MTNGRLHRRGPQAAKSMTGKRERSYKVCHWAGKVGAVGERGGGCIVGDNLGLILASVGGI